MQMRRHQRTDRERVLDDRQHPTGSWPQSLNSTPIGPRSPVCPVPGGMTTSGGGSVALTLLTYPPTLTDRDTSQLFADGAGMVNVLEA
jgi:hypothetical protein